MTDHAKPQPKQKPHLPQSAPAEERADHDSSLPSTTPLNLNLPKNPNPQTILQLQGVLGNRQMQQLLALKAPSKPAPISTLIQPSRDEPMREQEVTSEQLAPSNEPTFAGAVTPPNAPSDGGGTPPPTDGAAAGTGAGANGAGAGSGAAPNDTGNGNSSASAGANASGGAAAPGSPASTPPTSNSGAAAGGGSASANGTSANGTSANTASSGGAAASSTPASNNGAGGGSAAGSASAGANGAGSAGGAAANAQDSVPLHMPPPPTGLSPEDNERLSQTGTRAGGVAASQQTMPSAESSVADARNASREPQAEADAKAEHRLAAALGEQPAPSLEIEELCQKIYKVIRDKRPPSEDDLGKADPKDMAHAAGEQLNAGVQAEAGKVEGSYDKMQDDPKGSPEKQPDPLEAPPTPPSQPEINAAAAAPAPVPAEDVSLNKDKEAADEKVKNVEKEWPASKEVQNGPLAEARQAQGELTQTAAEEPARVLANQQAVLTTASADMAALQAQALQALQESRTRTVSNVQQQQTGMVGSEEQMRENVGKQASDIFTSAQQRVDTLMRDVPTKAMQKWQAGVDVCSTQFKQRLDKVQKWIDERHSDDLAGALTSLGDSIFGLPDWITDEYDAAEKQFGDGVCNLLREISREVNSVVAASQAIIKQAREDIAELYNNLPANLQNWAAQEKAKFDQQLDTLSTSVNTTRDNFNRDLRAAAAGAVQQVRQEVHALREKAKGLVGRIADAINAFLEDPVKFIINGLLELVGIPPASFWALVDRIQGAARDIAKDPMKFANNLVQALKSGFEKFFDNVGKHLLDGLLQWLFAGLGAVGITVPKDFSLQSVITFFMQLLGISWSRIRKMIAKHVGEENVALIEKAWGMISRFIQEGPLGIFKLIEDKINPQQILDTVLKAAIDFVVETLIKQVAMRIIGMLNPAGAIAQAIEIIYKVFKWIFENAARIFSLIETVVSGISDIISGNINGMAMAIEQALAKVLPVVIDFLADLLGLGDLPKKVGEAIKGVQELVEKGLDTVIGWLAKQAKNILDKLGFGGKKEEADAQSPPADRRMVLVAEAITSAEGQYADGMSREDAEAVAASARQRVPDLASNISVVDGKDSWEYNIALIQRAKPKDSDTVDSGKPKKIAKMKPQQKVNFTFNTEKFPKSVRSEFERQLQQQEDEINLMKVGEWIKNRNRFEKHGREKGEAYWRSKMCERLRTNLQDFYEAQGDSSKVAKRKADKELSGVSPLHKPDQVAGGEGTPEEVDVIFAKLHQLQNQGAPIEQIETELRRLQEDWFGLRRVNTSIGSQWGGGTGEGKAQLLQYDVEALVPEDQYDTTLMNVKLILQDR